MNLYIITGTGRCGTGYISKVLTSVGIRCSHEQVFKRGGLRAAQAVLAERASRPEPEGDSSWMAAPHLTNPSVAGMTIVHLVRHPFDFIQSHIRMCNWDGRYVGFNQYTYNHLKGLQEIPDPVHKSAFKYVMWNEMIEPHAHVFHRIEDDVRFLLDALHIDWQGKSIFEDTRYNHRQLNDEVFDLARAMKLPEIYREPLLDKLDQYGYARTGGVALPVTYKERVVVEQEKTQPVIKAIITTMDNWANNIEQLNVLRDDPLISEIIVVNQDSQDGTRQGLDAMDDIIAIHRQNDGAGPGRNAGLDRAGQFDYVLMLDGGIRPLRLGTQRMLEYLDRHPEVDGVATDWHFLETDKERAWRRWTQPISDKSAYRNRALSETHYGLFRARCWDGLRFADWYPFNQPGWGADDDEMMHRWNDAGIVIHAVQDVAPYRRASGSFRRLEKESGIWPNAFGSNYEERCRWLTQEQPQYGKIDQWGEPWLTVVVRAGGIDETARIIKTAHNRLQKRRLDPPYDKYWNPYSVVLWAHDSSDELMAWAQARRLRAHYGDTIIEHGQIIKRTKDNEETWTGDFRVWTGENWADSIRPNAFYYGLVSTMAELDELLKRYDEVHPRQPHGGMNKKHCPQERREL